MNRELEEFRSQWIQEVTEQQFVGGRKNSAANVAVDAGVDENASPEAQAMQIFQRGAEKERAGLFYDAITLYKRALAMDDMVETKIADLERKQAQQQKKQPDTKKTRPSTDNTKKPDEITSDCMLQEILAEHSGSVCQRADPEKNIDQVHLSQLPWEVMTRVADYVVSNELDYYSLERLAQVSRGFYRLARNDALWHAGCMRLWTDTGSISPHYHSWREMYLQRVAVRFLGVYMSRVTYLRAGETSFVDKNASSYRPWQDVTFFRFFRFHPDGSCVMLCSTDEPTISVERLKPRFPLNSPEILTGVYKLCSDAAENNQENILSIVLTRKESADSRKNRRRFQTLRNQAAAFENFAYADELRIELVICNGKTRRNIRLEWRKYEIDRTYENGRKSRSLITLTPQQFPALIFSRVKSYSGFDRCAAHVKPVVY